jgi:hypothetical protein
LGAVSNNWINKGEKRMSMKLSEIAEEIGVPVCILTAEEIKWAGIRGSVSKQREVVLLAELKAADDFWKNPKYCPMSVHYL